MNRDISWLFERPIAHRGMRFDDIPENSMTSFKEAVDAGLVIELDVQCLRDGTVVVFHDFDTLRVTGKAGMVMSHTQKSIKKLRLKGSDEQIPTLKEVLELVGGKVGLLIELKVMMSYKKLCKALLATLEGYKGKVALQGFSQRAMCYIAENSDYPVGVIGMDYRKTGLIGFYGYWLNRVVYFDRIKPDFLNYNYMHIPSPTTKRFAAQGVPIIGWTIRNQKQFEQAKGRCRNVIVETKYLDKAVLSKKYNDKEVE